MVGGGGKFRQTNPNDTTGPARPGEAGQKVVNLALQGGGSHGAFTWGVLDRLLEEERLASKASPATSAGAVNAVVLADGLAAGGREARETRCGAIGKKSPRCRRAASSRLP